MTAEPTSQNIEKAIAAVKSYLATYFGNEDITDEQLAFIQQGGYQAALKFAFISIEYLVADATRDGVKTRASFLEFIKNDRAFAFATSDKITSQRDRGRLTRVAAPDPNDKRGNQERAIFLESIANPLFDDACFVAELFGYFPGFAYSSDSTPNYADIRKKVFVWAADKPLVEGLKALAEFNKYVDRIAHLGTSGLYSAKSAFLETKEQAPSLKFDIMTMQHLSRLLARISHELPSGMQLVIGSETQVAATGQARTGDEQQRAATPA